MPHGELHSPYGATEALPVSSVSAAEIDPATVRGACVGRPLPGISVKIIGLDTPGGELREVPAGDTGEIIVSGPVVTKAYDALPVATAAAKISDGDRLWHRMGDCGYFDADGRLWFCGRKVESVPTAAGRLFTEPCEQVFRSHPRATRCALIGLGDRELKRPALVAETAVRSSKEARVLARELRQLALAHPHTSAIKVFYFLPDLPVDVRHNAKVHRLALATWAVGAKGYESDPKR
jgi:acyl-CoA synthetase (AMP-forming)/AMP-acid ligase II